MYSEQTGDAISLTGRSPHSAGDLMSLERGQCVWRQPAALLFGARGRFWLEGRQEGSMDFDTGHTLNCALYTTPVTAGLIYYGMCHVVTPSTTAGLGNGTD